MQNQKTYPHYFKKLPVGDKSDLAYDPELGQYVAHLDIYDVLRLWGVSEPGLQHAVKKLLVPGRRGTKDLLKDLKEGRDAVSRAIDQIERYAPKSPVWVMQDVEGAREQLKMQRHPIKSDLVEEGVAFCESVLTPADLVAQTLRELEQMEGPPSELG